MYTENEEQIWWNIQGQEYETVICLSDDFKIKY